MAMFGFVYAWYLMVVLLLEIWFDYRHDLVKWSARETGFMRLAHRVLTLGATDVSPRALRFDNSAGRIITIVGIPSAFLLHGYVGFIFGSVKANPWWSSVLIPVVFLFSAIVSGIAAVLLIYVVSSVIRRKPVDEACLGKLGAFLFYALTVDFSLEMLDFIHRLYTAEESIKILSALVTSRLFISLVLLQVLVGTLIPLITLALTSPAFERRPIVRVPAAVRRRIFVVAAFLVEIGIFSTRWNVVIGGQLFSKSLRGLTVYKLQLYGLEGLWMAIGLLLLPLAILLVLIWLLPPWTTSGASGHEEATPAVVATRN
jgi:Ni/Fe-hydrogenase subunit HybB-like protein